MAVENKQFGHRGYDGVHEKHDVKEGSHKKFMFPSEDAPVAVVTAFCTDGHGTVHLSETDKASLVYFDGKEGFDNGMYIESNSSKDFKDGEAVAVIDKSGLNTWLLTYSPEQGVPSKPLTPLGSVLKREIIIPNNQTTQRKRNMAREELKSR